MVQNSNCLDFCLVGIFSIPGILFCLLFCFLSGNRRG